MSFLSFYTLVAQLYGVFNTLVKSFFNYRRLNSVTDLLSELGLTSFHLRPLHYLHCHHPSDLQFFILS